MDTAQQSTLLRHIHKLAAGARARQQTDRQLLDEFAARGDQAAFAGLVARHGPMVLRVCRRVLGHEQDAEDAFQATFLVLARHTRSIRLREAVAGWLHGVAYRTAMKAKRSAARRRNHEARLRDLPPRQTPSPSWDDVQSVLDEEVGRLPEPFRAAFVLCVLQGKSGPEAATELGVKEGTMSSRLTRARKQLQQQLSRRGIQLSALLAALSLAEGGVKAAVPAALAHATICSGLLTAAGETAAGVIPPHVAALAAGVTRAMLLTKAKIATAAFVAVSLFATGAGVLTHHALAAKEPQPPVARKVEAAAPQADAKPQAATNDDKDATTYAGRVLDPEGKPVAGAKLFVCERKGKSAAPQPAADRDGRFRFALATTPASGPHYLFATANGLGLDWVALRPAEAAQELTLRLPTDVPIRGKVVDLEGKPVAGAGVRLVELTTSASGNLDEFVKQWAADKEKTSFSSTFRLLTEKVVWPHEVLRHLSATTTGPDGTFRLTGIGRDRGLMLGVRATGMADQYMRVVTRPDFPAVPAAKGREVALSGPEPTVVVAPSKPIMGTLRDAKTKQPLAGIRVLAYTTGRPIDWGWKPVETTTDAQGRYRLDGLAKNDRQIVTFDPGAGAPHLHRFDEVGDTEGFAPIPHDSELHRGIVVSGQVTDRSTGRPVRARIVYAPLRNNDNYTSTPGYDKPRTEVTLWVESREMSTGDDGSYRLTALPGPGALFVQAGGAAGRFIQPVVPREDQDPAIYRANAEVFMTLGLGDIFPIPHLHAYRLIRPAADADAETVNFALDPGQSRTGRLIDPDGKPLSGAEAVNLTPPSAWKAVLPGAEFTAKALNPAKPRRLLFLHEERKLAGTVVLRGDEPEPVTVSLQPLAAFTGRAVNKTTGEPLVGYSVEYSAYPEVEWPGQDKSFKREPNLTDKEGRFRVTDLPAGVPLTLMVVQKSRYAVIVIEKIMLQPGQTKDLGDRRGQPEDEP
jgi:RNA polymerase sigma factor (sigma-70 family)